MHSVEGHGDGSACSIAVVCSRFNAAITDRLLDGAIRQLRDCQVAEEKVRIVRVPGSFEIPYAARRIAAAGNFDAVVCLGAVIRGETPHFDYICQELVRGLGAISERYELPVIFGVLTTDSVAQAMDRSGNGSDNKGVEAVKAAVEMVTIPWEGALRWE